MSLKDTPTFSTTKHSRKPEDKAKRLARIADQWYETAHNDFGYGVIHGIRMTNADKIRQMTDEELEALLNNVMVNYDQVYVWIQGKLVPNISTWLKQEADG